jgi:hypothetical protein
LDTSRGEESEGKWGHESRPHESAFHIADHHGGDHGIDPQDDFAEPAVAQEGLQYMNENQQTIEPMIESARETAVEISTALWRSVWRMKTGNGACTRRQHESV